MMTDFRCPGCRRLLARVSVISQVEIKCRCGVLAVYAVPAPPRLVSV